MQEAVCTIFMMVFGMTRMGGKLTTHRVRGGHANHYANPTRFEVFISLTYNLFQWLQFVSDEEKSNID